MKTTIENTEISKYEELNIFAEMLRSNGFTIVAPETPSSYYHFWNGKGMGYVQVNSLGGGISFSSDHKACIEAGTAYNIVDDGWLEELTLANAKKACSNIVWPQHAGKIKFYKSVDEYVNYYVNRLLKYRIFEPIG